MAIPVAASAELYTGAPTTSVTASELIIPEEIVGDVPYVAVVVASYTFEVIVGVPIVNVLGVMVNVALA